MWSEYLPARKSVQARRPRAYNWVRQEATKGTEQDLQAGGVEYRTGVFPFVASGRARAMGENGGMVKIISDARSDRILGIHILGPSASELIAEAVLAMEFQASTEDLQRTIHAHPSLAEAIHEASLAVDRKALNYPNK